MAKRNKFIRIVSIILAISMVVGIFSVFMLQALPFIILLGIIIYLVNRFYFKKRKRF